MQTFFIARTTHKEIINLHVKKLIVILQCDIQLRYIGYRRGARRMRSSCSCGKFGNENLSYDNRHEQNCPNEL